MTWTPGKVVVAIGALHEAVGLAAGAGAMPMPGAGQRNLLAELVRAGVVGAVEPDPIRQVFFWYFFFGLLLLMWGWLLDRWEGSGAPLPAAAGWQLLALALAGGLLIPASGFWLALGPGAWVIRRARRAAGPQAAREAAAS